MSTTPRPQSKNGTAVHIILTGASGYLGQHLLSHWITDGVLPDADADAGFRFRITALYHKSEGFPKAVRDFRQRYQQQNQHQPVISDIEVRSIDLTDQGDIESFVRSLVLPSQVGVEGGVGGCDGDGDGDCSTSTSACIVVHAAALSSPRACQENPEGARAINVPTKFFDAILASSSSSSSTSTSTSILALSTDQVYDGRQESGTYYKEDEKEGLKPLNVYGQTKLELEGYLSRQQQQRQQQHRQSSSPPSTATPLGNLLVALRSSIILGPKAPIDPACAHGTFLDFCRSRGHGKEATTFFTNEYRSVVRVDRVISTIGGLVSRTLYGLGTGSSGVYNMGGPVRVNRMDMARSVFDKFGYDRTLLVEAEQTSLVSPLDISMDSSLLFEEGILREEEDQKGDGHQQQQDSETYLKELVDYVFAGEE